MRSAFVTLPLLAHLLVFAEARAQKGAPFTATVSMTRKVLAVGECSAVSLDLKDASGKDWPRGPNGNRVSMADFDLIVSAPAARAAVGQYDGPNSFAVCACPKAPVGTVATVTATYPSKWIAPKARVPEVSFATSTSAPIAAGASSGNPPGCDAPNASTGGPWTVTIQPSVSALAIGSCSAVSLTIRDSTGKTTPRNPAGTLVSIADFEMSATTANGADVVGTRYSPGSFSACACQTGTVGEAATITAKYPGSQLDPKARVPRAEMQVTAPITLAKAVGATNPPGCGVKPRMIASIAPRSGAPGASATAGAAGVASANSEKTEAAQNDAAGSDPRAHEDAPNADGTATAGAAGAAVSAGSQKAGEVQGSAAGSDQRAHEDAPNADGTATAGAAGAAVSAGSQKAGEVQGSAAGSDQRAHEDAPNADGTATAGAAGAAVSAGSQKAGEVQGSAAGSDQRAHEDAPTADGGATAGAAGAAAGAGSQKAGDAAQGTAAGSDPHAQGEALSVGGTAAVGGAAAGATAGAAAGAAGGAAGAHAATAPAPTGVAVAWTRGTAHVTWNAVNGAQRYAVWRAYGKTPSIERTPAAYSATQFADSIADTRQTYRYVVIAYFADGSRGESPAVQFTPSAKSKP